jgi:hypothetical protein
MPAATLVMRRSLPGAPTDTVFAKLATEPLPTAAEFRAVPEEPSQGDGPCSACLGSNAKGRTLIATRNAVLALRRTAGAARDAAKSDRSRSNTGRGCRLLERGRLRDQ